MSKIDIMERMLFDHERVPVGSITDDDSVILLADCRGVISAYVLAHRQPALQADDNAGIPTGVET